MTVRLENEISTTSLSWCARPLVARLRQKMNKALKRNGEVPE
jgi:hypothetical protein